MANIIIDNNILSNVLLCNATIWYSLVLASLLAP